MKNAIVSYKGTVFTVLAFSGLTLLALRWFFSSSNASKPFDINQSAKHLEGSVAIAKKLFDKIVNLKANNGWDWIYTSQKDAIYKVAKNGIDGIRFGNCCALGKEIIRNGRILSADELKKIVQIDKFPKRALGFKLFQQASHEIYKRVCRDKNTSAFERPSQLTLKEQEQLGEKAQCFCYQRHVECLQTYGLSFQDVSNLTETEFGVLQFLIRIDAPFSWAREKIYKKIDLKTGIDLIKWGASQYFPSIFEPLETEENLQSPLEENHLKLLFLKTTSEDQEPDRKLIKRGASQHFPSSFENPIKKENKQPTNNPLYSFPDIIHPKNPAIVDKEAFYWLYEKLTESALYYKCLDIKDPNFSGFFIVSETQIDRTTDQAFVLEIDNKTQTYVLYDGNIGFYAGKNLEDCINKLNEQSSPPKLAWIFYPYVFKS